MRLKKSVSNFRNAYTVELGYNELGYTKNSVLTKNL